MINIDDRILETLEPNELWLLIHIVKRLNKEHTAFPSKRTLLNDTRWKSEKTLRAALDALVAKKILSISTRTREDGSQTSNLYRVITALIGVYKPANELQEMVKNTVGGVQKMQGGEVQKMQPPRGKKMQGGGGKKDTPNEVLSNQVLDNEVLNNEPLAETKFRRETVGEVMQDFEMNGEPLPVKQLPKQKTPPELREAPPAPKQPTETYLMYEAWAQFVESKGVVVAKNATGTSYQFAPKDGSAIKQWREWCAGLPNASGSLDDWQVFLQAAWEHGGKWYQSNFTPCILNSKRQELMAAFARYKAKNEPDMSLVGMSIEEILQKI